MNVLAYFKQITTFVFDVDGVLTDGTVLVLDNRLQARRMNIKDGLALQMALKKGYRVRIISGAFSQQVIDRLEKLGVKDVHTSISNKQALLEEYMNANNLRKEVVLYMGDDLPDIPAMKVVGLPCCPADAVPEVKEAAKYISHLNGGFACVRDVIEKVLKLNDHWNYSNDIASK